MGIEILGPIIVFMFGFISGLVVGAILILLDWQRANRRADPENWDDPGDAEWTDG